MDDRKNINDTTKKNEFIIPHKLASLNDYILACRCNKYAGATFKKDIEEVIGYAINAALASNSLHKPTKPVMIRFEWHEKTKRRDADNIASAKKYILDALVTKGVLQDDSRRYVKGFYDHVIDDKEDYVKIELIEI